MHDLNSFCQIYNQFASSNHMANVLLTCIEQANLEALRQVIEQSPELLTLQDLTGKTPIFAVPSILPDAVASQFLEVFVQAGANFSHQDVYGRTVAFVICEKGMEGCLAIVTTVDKGALYQRDRLGQTPLFGAVRNHQIAFIRRTPITADLINVEDDVFGHTVLYYAAACGYDDLCMVLLKKGGNPFIRDRCGQTILSYTKKTPRFDFEVRRLMKARQKQAEMAGRSGMQSEVVDDTLRKQAYDMRALRNNQVKQLSAEEKKQYLQKYRQLQEKQKEEAYFQDPEFDPYDNYNQNWRNVAIKIVNNCSKHKNGMWFEHTGQAVQLLPAKELRGLPASELMGLSLVLKKLEHHIYLNAHEFMADMDRIWVNCEKMNGPYSRITIYARELRDYYYDLLSSYKYLDNYSY